MLVIAGVGVGVGYVCERSKRGNVLLLSLGHVGELRWSLHRVTCLSQGSAITQTSSSLGRTCKPDRKVADMRTAAEA